MFTVYLSSRLVINSRGEIIKVQKEKPILLFKGAAHGKIAREIVLAAAHLECDAYTTPNGEFFLIGANVCLGRLTMHCW